MPAKKQLFCIEWGVCEDCNVALIWAESEEQARSEAKSRLQDQIDYLTWSDATLWTDHDMFGKWQLDEEE